MKTIKALIVTAFIILGGCALYDEPYCGGDAKGGLSDSKECIESLPDPLDRPEWWYERPIIVPPVTDVGCYWYLPQPSLPPAPPTPVISTPPTW